MNPDNLSKNPFACLFRSASQVENEIKNETEKAPIIVSKNNDNISKKLNYLLEKIFLFTLDNDFKNDLNHLNSCVYIGDDDDDYTLLNLSIMSELLLKRLQIDTIDDSLIRFNKNIDNKMDLYENRKFYYLFNSLKRLNKFKNELNKIDNNDNYYNNLFELCINMSKTVVELNSDDDEIIKQLSSQLIDLINEKLADDFSILNQYLNQLFKKFEDDDDTNNKFIICLFDILNEKLLFKDCDYYSTQLFQFIDLVILLTNNKFMKINFLKTCFPKLRNQAINWQKTTLLGKFLTPHFLPSDKKYLFFLNPIGITQHDVEINQNNMWQRQQQINLKQIELFKHFLLKESNDIRYKLLEWIGECLYLNRNKAQEWSNYINRNDLYVSDGFMFNLLIILLDLAAPFSKPYSQSLLKIDPSYSLINDHQTFDKIHFKGYDKETKFCMFENNDGLISKEHELSVKSEYNFVTECFYGTHKCFQLSFISLYQKLMKINQELSRTQSTYEELRQQFGGDTYEPVRQMRILYEQQITEFLNLKTALTQLNLVEMSSKFFSATSSWLAYLSTCKQLGESIVSENINNLDNFKSQTSYNKYLISMIPEFFLININEFIIFLSRFQDHSIDLIINESEINIDHKQNNCELNPLMIVILLFMGNSDFLFNPHCRAQLAECLEAFLPSKASNKKIVSSYIKEKREFLFKNKLCVKYLPDALLSVFVSIEMTGQSVQFEQKFNYRRPMYEILEYIWTIDTFKARIDKLSKFAQKNIENSDQPLFLRFINLLINDSNYLLLEGLLYLEKIKIKQEELNNFSSQNPSASVFNNQDRNQLESSLKHLIMLARFHNIMSIKTLHVFRLLTTDISYFFCESILVDRVAAMLNDFLLHLVGAKQRQLKVNNFKEVEFNPHDIVSTICDIYLNLGVNEEFCRAVCRDGRSYSNDLFPLATAVLERLKRPSDIIARFDELGKKIEEISRIQQIEDSNYDDAPEEFLDPIMNHLMVDPVILPSSKKVIDRSTISRHLLSDQSDPFNRIPLSLQDVVPDVDLKTRINEWKASKRAKST